MAANVNNYIAAGNAAVKNSYAALAAARDNSPKYDEIAKAGMKARAEQKISAMQADANVKRSQIEANSYLKRNEIKLDTEKSLRKSGKKQQFAGKIAAAGAVMATALMPAAEIIKPGTIDYSRSQQRLDQMKSDNLKEIDRLETQKPATGTTVATAPSSPTTGFNPDSGTPWGRLGRTIRYAEGTSGDAGYTTMFTHARFSDLSRHPRQLQSGGGHTSDAAGAYQFLSTTWDGAKNALDLKDFSPASQEAAGEWLAQRRGVDTSKVYTNKADFTQAIDRLAPEWAGLPTAATGTSYYGQGGKNIDQLWAIYNQ